MEALQLARFTARSHISLPGYLLSARGGSTSVCDIARKFSSCVVVHSNRGSTRTIPLDDDSSTGGSYLADIDTYAQGRPTLFGKSVLISPSIAAMTTGQKSIAFGDFSRFIRREVANSLTTKTFVEHWAEYG
ncbi:MAG: phage major capsid protein [Candidatus Acidiferrum sp.]